MQKPNSYILFGRALVKQNAVQVYLSTERQRVECGLNVKLLWKKVSRVKGGWGLHTIQQLYWQEVGQLCLRIPLTDVCQIKYFHSWRGKGGNYMFYNISQWKWWKLKGKTHVYDSMVVVWKPTPPQSWSWEISSDDQLLSSHSLGSCFLHLSHECDKGSRFLFLAILIWSVWWQ